jgi:arylsulfatase
LDFLEETGQGRNTFIMFFSDNGPEGNPIQNLEDNAQWIPRRFDNRYENMGRVDSYVFYGPGWAQATAAPFRLFKAFPTEGGIRVPAIVTYPRRVGRSALDDTFVSVKDVAPTLLDLAGVSHPGPYYDGRQVLPMQGESMLPFLKGEATSVHGGDYVMGWELFGRRALRKGDWKLMWLPEPYGPSEWALYHLAEDPGESNDLSESEPEKLLELLALWEDYVTENGVILPIRSVGYADERWP